MIAEIWVETKGWQPSVSFCLIMIKIFLLTWILENKTYLKPTENLENYYEKNYRNGIYTFTDRFERIRKRM